MWNTAPLNNPVWSALTSAHSHLGTRNNEATTYLDTISPLSAIARMHSSCLDDLTTICPPSRSVWLLNTTPMPTHTGWSIQKERLIDQMICTKSEPYHDNSPLVLGAQDVPEMMALIQLTQPGPFLVDTMRMGKYVGIRSTDHQLLAIAGLRMHGASFIEISAVCTHPEHQGKGYAKRLIRYLVQHIMEQKKLPMLHVKTENSAKHVYQQLGFMVHQEIYFSVLQPSS